MDEGATGPPQPAMMFDVTVMDDSDGSGSGSEADANPAGKKKGFASATFDLPTVAMPATMVTVPSEIRYHSARRHCRVPAAMPVQRSAVGLELSRQLQCRVYLSLSDEPEVSQLDGFEDWALIMEAYRSHSLTIHMSEAGAAPGPAAEDGWTPREGHESDGAGEAGPATMYEPAPPPPSLFKGEDPSEAREVKLRRAMEPAESGGMRNRFVFAHSRGLFIGMRVHAFVMCPRVMAPDIDLRAFAADMVHVTRLALGAMIGIQRPLVGMGQEDAGSRKWGDLFFPPRRGGEAFMFDLIKAMYTAVHSDVVLELYS